MSRPRVTEAMRQEMAADGFRTEVRVRRAHCDMTQAALAEAIGMDKAVLCQNLKAPDKLTVGRLRKMIQALDLDPLAVLALLGYDEKVLKNLTRNNGQNT